MDVFFVYFRNRLKPDAVPTVHLTSIAVPQIVKTPSQTRTAFEKRERQRVKLYTNELQ